ncbi:MAG TPA: hypothetical protein VGR70_12735 [Stellaceae bacterium]|nr:hypothetical protein [Stellaceae bacterium]
MNPGRDSHNRLAEVQEVALVLHFRPVHHRVLEEMPFVRYLDPVGHVVL